MVGFHIVVMITSNALIFNKKSYFAIDIMTALKSSLKHRHKHVLQRYDHMETRFNPITYRGGAFIFGSNCVHNS